METIPAAVRAAISRQAKAMTSSAFEWLTVMGNHLPGGKWGRGPDLNRRPSTYEADEHSRAAPPRRELGPALHGRPIAAGPPFRYPRAPSVPDPRALPRPVRAPAISLGLVILFLMLALQKPGE